MTLLDRYIIRRFLANFAILFMALYLLATSIDIILQLDDFVSVVEETYGEDLGIFRTAGALGLVIFDFHGPRIFQLYAYLLGLVSVGAMAFTLAQMYRYKELVAILASGTSLYRIAWPIVVAAFGLNLLHLVNSNVILPRVAPLLIRGHGEMKRGGVTTFAVPFTRDSRGALLQSPLFHTELQTLDSPTILERDAEGRTLRRITADKAVWSDEQGAWMLTNGTVVRRSPHTEEERAAEDSDRLMRHGTIDSFATDLSPHALIVKRYATFAQMLSPAQIDELLSSPGVVDAGALARIKFGRYSVVLTNLLLLLLTMPFFLLREPASLLRQSIWCAGAALTVMLGAFIGMEVELPGFPAMAGVFLPVVILIPLTLFSIGFVRS